MFRSKSNRNDENSNRSLNPDEERNSSSLEKFSELNPVECVSPDSTTDVVQLFDSNHLKQRTDENKGKVRLKTRLDCSTPEVHLYRSKDQRSLSNSTISRLSDRTVSSSSDIRRKQVDETVHLPSFISSVEIDEFLVDSSKFSIRFPSIEYHPTIDQQTKQMFDQIREEFREEFFCLIPKLLQCRILKWPKKFFKNDFFDKSNEKEQIERKYFISILKKDQENDENKRYRRRKYFDEVQHENHLLRDSLSYQGQLSLLRTYQDHIEEQFDRLMPSWRSILLSSNRLTKSDENSSISNRSTTKTKSFFKQKKSIFFDQIDEDVLLIRFNEIHLSIDPLWKEKLIVFFIEQLMNLFDQSKILRLNSFHSVSSDFHPTNSIVSIHQLISSYQRSVRLTSLIFFSSNSN